MDITDVLENQSFVHVGVDLAKNVFQVAYEEQRSNTLVNQQMNRTKFEKFLNPNFSVNYTQKTENSLNP